MKEKQDMEPITGNYAESIKGHLVAITDLYPDPANARRHPEKNIEAIKNSLKRFGQDQLIVACEDGKIIIGNGRYEAAKQLGWTHVAAIKVPMGTSEATARAIADNRTGELAEWDEDILVSQLDELGDLAEGIGFDEELEFRDEHGEIEIRPMDEPRLPTMAWVLVGIPLDRYDEIDEAVQGIAALDDVIIETTANNGTQNRQRKLRIKTRAPKIHVK